MYLRIKKFELEDVEWIERLKEKLENIKIYMEIPYIEIAKEFSNKKYFSNKKFKEYFIGEKKIEEKYVCASYRIASEGVLKPYDKNFAKEFCYMNSNLIIKIKNATALPIVLSEINVEFEYSAEDILCLYNYDFKTYEMIDIINKKICKGVEFIDINNRTREFRQLKYLNSPQINMHNFLNMCIAGIIKKSNYIFKLNNYLLFNSNRHYFVQYHTIIQKKGRKLERKKLYDMHIYLEENSEAYYIVFEKEKEYKDMKQGGFKELRIK